MHESSFSSTSSLTPVNFVFFDDALPAGVTSNLAETPNVQDGWGFVHYSGLGSGQSWFSNVDMCWFGDNAAHLPSCEIGRLSAVSGEG